LKTRCVMTIIGGEIEFENRQSNQFDGTQSRLQ
jgi:hypothetical protein